jgi:hypothetical protein
MEEKNKFWIRIFFLIFGIIIFFLYYKTELIHNLDHLPIFIQDLIKRIFFIK